MFAEYIFKSLARSPFTSGLLSAELVVFVSDGLIVDGLCVNSVEVVVDVFCADSEESFEQAEQRHKIIEARTSFFAFEFIDRPIFYSVAGFVALYFN